MRFQSRRIAVTVCLVVASLIATSGLPVTSSAEPVQRSEATADVGVRPQVYNGNAVLSPNPYPWMTAIMQTRFGDPFTAFICGGVVVASHWVLTAAHCVDRVRNDEVQVVPGVLDLLSVGPSQRRTVSEVHVHPQWRTSGINHDVALLRTKEPLNVPPVALISPFRPFGTGTNGVVLGWGGDGFGGRPTNLVWGSVKVADAGGRCGSYSTYNFNADTMFCAGGNGLANSTDTCRGDSGGPVIIPVPGGWEVAGVTSWGLECGLPGYPGVYTRLTTYRDWIRGITSRMPPGDPLGSLDSVSLSGNQVRATGWGFDPDSDAPMQVHLYVDGRYTTRLWANVTRADVAAVYPAHGANRGFSATLNLAGGNRRVCAYAINVGAGSSNPLLGCRTVKVPGREPFGNVDRVVRESPSTVRVFGWTIDPDTTDAVWVHAYRDGRWQLQSRANAARVDIGQAFPGYGMRHGFDLSVRAAPGAQVCIYAINVGAGVTNPLLGCRRV